MTPRAITLPTGDDLLHEEGAIMVRTVLRCLERDVIVLPLHDRLLVAEPHKGIARVAMHEAFREYTGGFIARVS